MSLIINNKQLDNLIEELKSFTEEEKTDKTRGFNSICVEECEECSFVLISKDFPNYDYGTNTCPLHLNEELRAWVINKVYEIKGKAIIKCKVKEL